MFHNHELRHHMYGKPLCYIPFIFTILHLHYHIYTYVHPLYMYIHHIYTSKHPINTTMCHTLWW